MYFLGGRILRLWLRCVQEVKKGKKKASKGKKEAKEESEDESGDERDDESGSDKVRIPSRLGDRGYHSIFELSGLLSP